MGKISPWASFKTQPKKKPMPAYCAVPCGLGKVKNEVNQKLQKLVQMIPLNVQVPASIACIHPFGTRNFTIQKQYVFEKSKFQMFLNNRTRGESSLQTLALA